MLRGENKKKNVPSGQSLRPDEISTAKQRPNSLVSPNVSKQ